MTIFSSAWNGDRSYDTVSSQICKGRRDCFSDAVRSTADCKSKLSRECWHRINSNHRWVSPSRSSKKSISGSFESSWNWNRSDWGLKCARKMEDRKSFSESLSEWIERDTAHNMIFSWSKECLIEWNGESFTTFSFASEAESMTSFVCDVCELRLDIIKLSIKLIHIDSESSESRTKNINITKVKSSDFFCIVSSIFEKFFGCYFFSNGREPWNTFDSVFFSRGGLFFDFVLMFFLINRKILSITIRKLLQVYGAKIVGFRCIFLGIEKDRLLFETSIGWGNRDIRVTIKFFSVFWSLFYNTWNSRISCFVLIIKDILVLNCDFIGISFIFVINSVASY